jgi:hypothetical protein
LTLNLNIKEKENSGETSVLKAALLVIKNNQFQIKLALSLLSSFFPTFYFTLYLLVAAAPIPLK